MRKVWLLVIGCWLLVGCVQTLPIGECQIDADCVKEGCSGTICQAGASEPSMTTCEWKEAYSCYQEQNCGCVDNSCQWDAPSALQGCLAQYE